MTDHDLLCVIEIPKVLTKIVGLFRMADEKGPDDHVVSVPCEDPGWNTLQEIDDLPPQLGREISHFFTVYKDLDPGRHSEVKGWGDRAQALEMIERCRKMFRSQQAGP